MTSSKQQLQFELRAEGVSEEEAKVMVGIAQDLAKLHVAQVRPERIRTKLIITSASLVMALFIAGASLTSLPGQALHPIKRAIIAVALKVHPEFNSLVMMDQSLEVAQLAEQHKPPKLIFSTLSDYNHRFASQDNDEYYAAWAYCAANLKQAREMTSGQTRKAIEQSLGRVVSKEAS